MLAESHRYFMVDCANQENSQAVMEKRRFTWGISGCLGGTHWFHVGVASASPSVLHWVRELRPVVGQKEALKHSPSPKVAYYMSFYIFLKKKEGIWEHLSERGTLGASRERVARKTPSETGVLGTYFQSEGHGRHLSGRGSMGTPSERGILGTPSESGIMGILSERAALPPTLRTRPCVSVESLLRSSIVKREAPETLWH